MEEFRLCGIPAIRKRAWKSVTVHCKGSTEVVKGASDIASAKLGSRGMIALWKFHKRNGDSHR
jgi:hypothetical protein